VSEYGLISHPTQYRSGTAFPDGMHTNT